MPCLVDVKVNEKWCAKDMLHFENWNVMHVCLFSVFLIRKLDNNIYQFEWFFMLKMDQCYLIIRKNLIFFFFILLFLFNLCISISNWKFNFMMFINHNTHLSLMHLHTHTHKITFDLYLTKPRITLFMLIYFKYIIKTTS